MYTYFAKSRQYKSIYILLKMTKKQGQPNKWPTAAQDTLYPKNKFAHV